MKKIIMLFFVFVIVLNLQAQKKINLSELNIDQLNLYKEQAIKMRNTGMILTFAGIAGYAIGGLLLANYVNKIPWPDMEGIEPWTYSILLMSGVASTVAGIPVWIIGGVKKSRAEIALMKFDIKPQNSMALGLGVTLRF